MARFLEKRYLETVGLLKDLGLWDLETGMKFLPIIQYCMPPPSFDKIHELLGNLHSSGVNTDWAPSSDLLTLRNKMTKAKVNISRRNTPFKMVRGDSTKYGTEYPISYGISKIAKQKDWGINRAVLIKKFVETVYYTTAKQSLLFSETYYRNIFNLRDVIITDFADYGVRVPTVGQFDKDIDEKSTKVQLIKSNYILLGVKAGKPVADSDRFWANPPEAKFTLPPDFNNLMDKTLPSHDNPRPLVGFEPGDFTRPPEPEDFLLNNTQQKSNPYYSQPKWVRNNVRSLADANQITWSTLFDYWERVLKAGKKEIFNLTLVTLLTGIRKRRWVNATYDVNTTLTAENMYISTSNTIKLTINRAAHVFTSNESYAKNFTILSIPKALQLDKKQVKAGLSEEGMARGFEAANPGIKPLLNNIARSGHTLLRKNIAGELPAFILAGDIPIEFKARNAYYQTKNSDVNHLLQRCIAEFKRIFSRSCEHYPLISKELKEINFADAAPVKEHLLGSQLAKPNLNFSKFSITPYQGNDLVFYIELLNNLELYYLWMLNYSYAIRPWGHETGHYPNNNLLLHQDKNSSDYNEAKLLFISNLVRDQKQELDKCRLAVATHHQVLKSSLNKKSCEQPLFHKYIYGTKTLESLPLQAKKATELAEKIWAGVKPVLSRSNAHRHQCASYIHRELGEPYADAWLGHHIDGWYFASPQASSPISILSDVSKIQQKWLKTNGFSLIRNPLQ